MSNTESQEPQATIPKLEKKKRRGRPPKLPKPPRDKPTHIPGSDLVSDLHKHERVTGAQYWYWVGALPSCPTEVLYLAGMGFPKMTEKVIPANKAGGKTQRIPRVGHVCKLNMDTVAMIRKQLPQIVLRFLEAPRENEAGVGATLDEYIDENNRPRKGYPLTIPTAEEIRTRRETTRTIVPYSRGEHDEPGARYIFAQLCSNQTHPAAGAVYPEPLETTGIEWPEDMQE